VTLFVERLLIERDEISDSVPEPARYDERRQISVTADGDPFVEASADSRLVTLTEASGEAVDDDDDDSRLALASTVTQTFTDTEAPDEHSEPRPPTPSSHQDASVWAVTITKADGEAPDAPLLATQTRQAPGESVGTESGTWAFTKTEANGEAPDA
jgi:hypothetical protein